MPRTSRLLSAVAAASVAAGVAVPAADAALPVIRDKTIVIGRSVAGVRIGSSPAAAKAAWGRRGGLCGRTNCFYRVSGDSNGTRGEGIVDFTSKVFAITLKAPLASGGGYRYGAPFTTPRTDRGIGIGSTVAQFKRAYPRAKDDRGFAFEIKSGSVTTLFKYESDKNRIFGIEMQSSRR